MNGRMQLALAEWGWLRCTEAGCGWECPGHRIDRLDDHTHRAHGRQPSRVERMPVVRELAVGDRLDAALIDGCERFDDCDGRVWCVPILGGGIGITRVDGHWCVARREPFKPLRVVTDPGHIAALERWELATIPTDGDPTIADPPRYLALVVA